MPRFGLALVCCAAAAWGCTSNPTPYPWQTDASFEDRADGDAQHPTAGNGPDASTDSDALDPSYGHTDTGLGDGDAGAEDGSAEDGPDGAPGPHEPRDAVLEDEVRVLADVGGAASATGDASGAGWPVPAEEQVREP